MPKKLEDILKELESSPEFKSVPPAIRDRIISGIRKGVSMVPFPIMTFKEGDWFVASTPIIDVCAQGKTEEEAVKHLKSMIDDYMADPDTVKPEINSVINAKISIKTIPIEFGNNVVGGNYGKNSPVATR